MRQSLRTLLLIAFFTFFGAENVIAVTYTAPEIPMGFMHIGNKNVEKKSIGNVEMIFTIDQMNSFLENPHIYAHKSNFMYSDYNLYLAHDTPDDIKEDLQFFFGNEFTTQAWLEFQGLDEAVDGVNPCHYTLKALYPNTVAPKEVIQDVVIMMKRILPTFAAMDTHDDFEAHLSLDRLGDPIVYKGNNYRFTNKQIRAIHRITDQNLPIEANDEVNPPIIAHPTSVIRTYWEEKTSKMKFIIFVNGAIVCESNIEIAEDE